MVLGHFKRFKNSILIQRVEVTFSAHVGSVSCQDIEQQQIFKPRLKILEKFPKNSMGINRNI